MLFSSYFFFFNDTATTEIYTLSLHDALPISTYSADVGVTVGANRQGVSASNPSMGFGIKHRSEEHTSELQSRLHLVCRLLLEKKKILMIREIVLCGSINEDSLAGTLVTTLLF